MNLPVGSVLTAKHKMSARALEIFKSLYRDVAIKTDLMFLYLFLFQWLVGIAFAIFVSPKTWIGSQGFVSVHIYAAIFLGGLIVAAPITLILNQPGHYLNRQIVAVSQMLFSILLVHLCGGRIETHFHIFGSLAFLAVYRDWKVLATATLITAVDHILRGLFWPQSVYGILTATPWRAFEHVGWVLFEDAILFYSIRNAHDELKSIAEKQAELERALESVELNVSERTASLQKETRFVGLLKQISFAANDAETTTEVIQSTLRLVCEGLSFPAGHAFLRGEDNELVASAIWYDNGHLNIAKLKEATEQLRYAKSVGLAARALIEQKATWLSASTVSNSLPRGDAIRESGVKVGLALPIFFKDKKTNENIIGAILEFFTDELIVIDDHTLAIANSIGVQLGRVVERMHSQELLAKRAQQLIESQKIVIDQEQALVASAKTSALGEMAGQAAHEINTPLGAIVLTAESMKEKIEAKDFDQKFLGQQLDLILRVTQKMARIISSMRKLAGHGGNDTISEVQLKTLIDDTVILCEGRFKKHGIVFEVLYENVEGKFLQCLPSEISQILINLLNNAFDAINLRKDKWVKLIASEKNNRLNIKVIDCGEGIKGESRSKIFTPNFTTKSLNQGTGFGLSISRKIAERHSGSLYVDHDNANTCFVLDIPWAQSDSLVKIARGS
jgi:signal transduction histidine kinase